MNGALPCKCLGSETEQQKDTIKKEATPQRGGGGPTDIPKPQQGQKHP
ncbi:Uncharacterised protein [Rikenella microfusus]|uniref:Uncharacterized protein n=1 Tax=Rikenella microfusus TaxID=28139 RepID=A0A379MPU9_9BACT|nr:Uncharacterised protein [Rikenella microfusus]